MRDRQATDARSAGPPALALGIEPTASDAMSLQPTEFKRIFTLRFYVDLFYYGVVMAALTLVNFIIVIYGYYDGNVSLGQTCNEGLNDTCEPVFRARGACFASLTSA